LIASVPSPTVSSPISTASDQAPDRAAARVISTGDGDTLRVEIIGDRNVTIRLACIDAPEAVQVQGAEAAARLRALLPNGAEVTLRTVDIDRYGRTVAEVYRNGRSLNLQLVAEGHAVIYTQYFDGYAATQGKCQAAEATARQQRLAFWSQPNPVMPWDWRQNPRTPTPRVGIPRPTLVATPTPRPTPSVVPTPRSTPQPAAASNCDPDYPGICIPINSSDLDCGDIPDRRFVVQGSDRHRFDGDRDGVGCES